MSGSGKSTLSQPLAASLGAVRIRSDVERKRLFGLPAEARSESAPGAGLYTPEAGRQTYQRLMALGRETLAAGYPVILDAAFLRRDQREMARRLADACDTPFVILDVQAEAHVLRTRIRQRTAAGGDASEAGLPVLERQIASREPLDVEEQHCALRIDAETAGAETVRAFLKRPSPHRLRG
ncbi:MAG TPA: hypothetical protein DEP05_08450 [Betaproteobacteria bacterium]|nr:hypothetical protein [Betaproteobacteria bacterium]